MHVLDLKIHIIVVHGLVPVLFKHNVRVKVLTN